MRRNQDRQALARDNHTAPRSARTEAATRSTATTSAPISNLQFANGGTNPHFA